MIKTLLYELRVVQMGSVVTQYAGFSLSAGIHLRIKALINV